MAKREKLKAAKIEDAQADRVHDRRAAVVPRNITVTAVTVEDAFGLRSGAVLAAPERKDGSTKPGEQEWRVPEPQKVEVLRSDRDDPLAALHASGQIDSVQFLSGRHWQYCHERSEVGTVKAIDPGKEAVDGGRLADPISQVQQRAIADLGKARRALGDEGNGLVRNILGEGLTVRQAAERRGKFSEAERKYVGKRFRECLDTLSVVFGYATRLPDATADTTSSKKSAA